MKAPGLNNGLLWITVAVVVLLGIWVIPEWQLGGMNTKEIPPAQLAALENEYRRTLAQVVAGLALFATLYFTWRRVTATERTVEISQESHITERFTQAIGQLGDDKLEVRLGAIYALERIAKDSEKDYWPIMEVLTAYLRNNAPWPPVVGMNRDPRDVPSDTQAVMAVLSRRDQHYKNGERYRLDLRKTDLRGIDFRGIHLEGALLDDSSLRYALLHDARLDGATLVGTDFKYASLTNASFYEAVLEKTDLQWAALSRASFEGEVRIEDGEEVSYAATIFSANFEKASLYGTKLKGVDLSDAENLTWEQVHKADTDEHTKLPDYLLAEPQSENGEAEESEN